MKRALALCLLPVPLIASILTGCASRSGSTDSAGPPAPPTPTSTFGPPTPTGGTAARLPTCQTSQLDLVQGRGGVALGNVGQDLSFRNHSSQSCSLTGYPSIQLFDAQGHAIPIQLHQVTGAYMFNNEPVQTVALANGSQAYFTVEWVDGSGSQQNCANSASAAITPPGNTIAITTALQVNECGGTLTTSPVEPAAF